MFKIWSKQTNFPSPSSYHSWIASWLGLGLVLTSLLHAGVCVWFEHACVWGTPSKSLWVMRVSIMLCLGRTIALKSPTTRGSYTIPTSLQQRSLSLEVRVMTDMHNEGLNAPWSPVLRMLSSCELVSAYVASLLRMKGHCVCQPHWRAGPCSGGDGQYKPDFMVFNDIYLLLLFLFLREKKL